MSEPERWLPVVGYEGRYEVSSLGRVRGVERECETASGTRRVPAKVLTQCLQGNGSYLAVTLCGGSGPGKAIYINRAVCEAFHGPAPSEDHHAAHFDGDSLNNRSSNLRWATPVENMADRDRHGTTCRGEQHHDNRLSEDDVRAIRASSFSRAELARRFGVSWTTIDKIIRRTKWKHVE